MVGWFLVILTSTILVLFGASALQAQQVTCTPSVPPTICKQFDSAFGLTSMWPERTWARQESVVQAGPILTAKKTVDSKQLRLRSRGFRSTK
jgi:hypothetical protein